MLNLTEFLSLAQTIILLGGLIVAFRQLGALASQVKLMMNQMYDQQRWRRKNVTFDYITNYIADLRETNLGLQKRLDLLRQDGKGIDVHAISSCLENDETRLQLFELVSYFEHLAIGIEEGFLDETIARGFLSNVVTSAYASLAPYLQIRREETGCRVGSNFEELARRWEKKPGSPATLK